MANVAITGAARGIALELVRQYAANGDRVFALCRAPSPALNALAAASGGKVTIHEMDVGSDASVKAGAASTGTDRIDILLNVAGVVGPMDNELETADWNAWNEAFNINTCGPLRVLQAFLPRMGAGSKVINFTSQVAASTWPLGGIYSYCATKGGLNRMMGAVAIDLKDRGIVVGLVHPGWVQTDMGGPNAEIPVSESAEGIRKITAEWTLDRSGAFLKWNGETHAW